MSNAQSADQLNRIYSSKLSMHNPENLRNNISPSPVNHNPYQHHKYTEVNNTPHQKPSLMYTPDYGDLSLNATMGRMMTASMNARPDRRQV